MLKRILTAFVLPLLLLFCSTVIGSSDTEKSAASQSVSGTLQKMIVESGSVTMDLDLNGLNGNGSLVARPVSLRVLCAVNPMDNSFEVEDSWRKRDGMLSELRRPKSLRPASSELFRLVM